MTSRILIVAGIALALFALTLFWILRGETALAAVHKSIAAEHQNVIHLDAEGFHKLDPSRRLVFDVREADEFAVSHIEGAIRLDPNMTPEAFEALYADRLHGQDAVFYCSVGKRSSMAAERLSSVLDAYGVDGRYNLAEGIFGWRNADYPLVSEWGKTEHVHPYDAIWGRLLEDRSALRYEPERPE